MHKKGFLNPIVNSIILLVTFGDSLWKYVVSVFIAQVVRMAFSSSSRRWRRLGGDFSKLEMVPTCWLAMKGSSPLEVDILTSVL